MKGPFKKATEIGILYEGRLLKRSMGNRVGGAKTRHPKTGLLLYICWHTYLQRGPALLLSDAGGLTACNKAGLYSCYACKPPLYARSTRQMQTWEHTLQSHMDALVAGARRFSWIKRHGGWLISKGPIHDHPTSATNQIQYRQSNSPCNSWYK